MKRKLHSIEVATEHLIINRSHYNKDISYKELKPTYPVDDVLGFECDNECQNTAYKVPLTRPARIYFDGIFDMFHYGHARGLQQAKNLFPNAVLVVGIPKDETTLKYKGSVILKDYERVESLKHCTHVDEIIFGAPWIVTQEFIKKYRIDFIAHDPAPYPFGNSPDIYGPFKLKNIFIPTKRTVGISTTQIVTHIVKDYDLYVKRNLKRGIPATDLNLGTFKILDIKVQAQVDRISENFKNEIRNVKGEFKEAMDCWEALSQKFVMKFANKIRKVDFWNDISGKFKRRKTLSKK